MKAAISILVLVKLDIFLAVYLQHNNIGTWHIAAIATVFDVLICGWILWTDK